MSSRHEELSALLGPYLLGGLNQTDRSRIEQHLDACRQCRAEVADLAPIPGLLARASGEVAADANEGAVVAPEPSGAPPPLETLLDDARRERRSRNRRLAAAGLTLAASVAAVGFAVGATWSSGETPDATTSFVAAQPGGITGEARLLDKPWGTEIQIDLASLPDDATFHLEAAHSDGENERTATWRSTDTGRCSVVGATSLDVTDVDELRVISENGEVLSVATPPEV